MAVIWLEPYRLLGKMEAQLDKLNAYAVTGNTVDSEIVLSVVVRYRQLHQDLLNALQRSRLEYQLLASLEMKLEGVVSSKNEGAPPATMERLPNRTQLTSNGE